MKPLLLTGMLVTSFVLGCATAPAPKASAMRVSAPANGACTITCVDRVFDAPVSSIYFRIPRQDSPVTTIRPVDGNGRFEPATMGDAGNPVRSGDVIEVQAWAATTQAQMASPKVSLPVP